MDKAELDKLTSEVGEEQIEQFREKVFALFEIEVPQGETAKKILQKAYLVF